MSFRQVLLSRHPLLRHFTILGPEQAPSLNLLLLCILSRRMCEFHSITSPRHQKDNHHLQILLFPHNHCLFLVATRIPRFSELAKICLLSMKMRRTSILFIWNSLTIVKFTHRIIGSLLGLCLELGPVLLLRRLMSHRHMAMMKL